MNTAIYLRVSTDDQRFDSQEHELRSYCDRRGWTSPLVFTDTASGAKTDRAGLDSLLAGVRKGEIDQVVVYKLDRLGRSLSHLALIIDELQRHAVALVATSQGIDTSHNNPAGRLQLNVLLAVAQFEREIIRERVNAGIAAAKRRGVKFGRPRKHSATPTELRALRQSGLGVRAIACQLGIAASTVSVLLKSAEPAPVVTSA